MQRWFMTCAAACGCACVLVNGVSAQVQIQIQAKPGVQVQLQQIQLQPIQAGKVAVRAPVMYNQTKLTQADAIFVGRVVAFEPMDVESIPAAGQAKVSYRIAVVQVSESIFGLKKDTQTVRVGFIAQANNGAFNAPGGGIQILPVAPGQPAIQPAFPPNGRFRPFPGNYQINLDIGLDGMFAVNKHPKETFYLAPNHGNFVARQNNPSFDTEVKTAKQLAKAMADPVAALKAEGKEDRYFAAAILIAKYRNVNNPKAKTEPISADESKLILQALAGGDWTPGRFSAIIPGPFELFNQLGVTAKDGYNPANLRNQQEFSQAMQKWLDENNGKYVINRLIPDPNAKAAPVVQPGVIQGGIIIRQLPPQIQPVPPAPVPEK